MHKVDVYLRDGLDVPVLGAMEDKGLVTEEVIKTQGGGGRGGVGEKHPEGGNEGCKFIHHFNLWACLYGTRSGTTRRARYITALQLGKQLTDLFSLTIAMTSSPDSLREYAR